MSQGWCVNRPALNQCWMDKEREGSAPSFLRGQVELCDLRLWACSKDEVRVFFFLACRGTQLDCHKNGACRMGTSEVRSREVSEISGGCRGCVAPWPCRVGRSFKAVAQGGLGTDLKHRGHRHPKEGRVKPSTWVFFEVWGLCVPAWAIPCVFGPRVSQSSHSGPEHAPACMDCLISCPPPWRPPLQDGPTEKQGPLES